jgi:hypothetical protein
VKKISPLPGSRTRLERLIPLRDDGRRISLA